MHVILFSATLLSLVPLLFGSPTSGENFVKCNDKQASSTSSIPCVVCTNLALTEVPNFGNVSPRINQLLLDHNNIEKLVDNGFSARKLIYLERIDLSYNLLVTIEQHAFMGLKNLTYLDVSFNNLSSLSPEVFVHVQSLTVLSIEGNPLITLTGGFPLPNLKTLDMTNCSLRTLPDRFFDSTTELQRVYLSKNKLSGNFGTDFFTPLKKNLKIIEMQDNEFKRIPLELLSLGVDKVNVHFNPWHCDCTFFKDVVEYRNTSIFKRLTCNLTSNLTGLSLADAERYIKCDSNVTEMTILSSDISHSTTQMVTERAPIFEEPLLESALERKISTPHKKSIMRHGFVIYCLNIALASAIIGILLAFTFYIVHTRVLNYYSVVRNTKHCYQTISHNNFEDNLGEPIYEDIH